MRLSQDPQGHGRRLHAGKDDAEEDAQLAGPVDAGRVQVVVGHGEDALAHEEHREGGEHHRDDQPGVGVLDAQPDREHQQRDHDGLEGDHHGGQDQHEDQLPAPEAELGQPTGSSPTSR